MRMIRTMWLALLGLLAIVTVVSAPAAAQQQKPNILVIFGDDIGVPQVSAYTMGLMGYRTPGTQDR
jgi:hypothetical protein